MFLQKLLFDAGLTVTGAEARRMISQKGVKVDGKVVNDIEHELSDGRYIVQVGKYKEKVVCVQEDEVVQTANPF